jgi:transposase
MQAVTTIGLDIARSVFQVHGIDAEGNAIIRRKLTAGTLAVLLKAETEKWSTVIKKANIALD